MILVYMLMQNPEVVALKEDIKRTSKKLKLWERELEHRNESLATQHSKVAKLKADLDKVTDGLSSIIRVEPLSVCVPYLKLPGSLAWPSSFAAVASCACCIGGECIVTCIHTSVHAGKCHSSKTVN